LAVVNGVTDVKNRSRGEKSIGTVASAYPV